MSISYILGLALCIAGAGNLFLFGMGFALAGRRADRFTPAASLTAFITAGAVLVITLVNFNVVRNNALLEGVEIALTLAVGPALFLLIAALVSRTPPMMHAVAPALAVGVLFAAVDKTTPGVMDIRPAVFVQIAYTLAAAAMFFRSGLMKKPKLERGAFWAAVILTAAGFIHVAQIIRMLAPHADFMSAVVPMVSALIACAGLTALARHIASLKILKMSRRASLPEISIEALRAALHREKGHLKADFRLADLAAATDCAPAEISLLINRETGAGFVQFVNRERLAAAQTLLLAPEEQKTSIEAIALMSGFKSRSAFYRAFTDAYGVTPGAFKRSAGMS